MFIMPVDNVVESILNTLPGFLQHVCVKWCQAMAYQHVQLDIVERLSTKCVVKIEIRLELYKFVGSNKRIRPIIKESLQMLMCEVEAVFTKRSITKSSDEPCHGVSCT